MNARLFAAAAALWVCTLNYGCSKPAQCPATAADARNLCINGIPNLHAVAGEESGGHRVFRGGQPTPEGWSYLHDTLGVTTLGVTTVVKLNAPEESWGQGVDEPARQLGMTVVDASIPPHDYGLVPRSLPQPFEGIPEDRIALAVATLANADHGAVYVHCTHGRDRTGLIVGLFRVLEQQWAPKKAWDEMNEEGFRPLNVNLFVYWERLFRDADDAEAVARREHLQALIREKAGSSR
jgi:hypothetical protein